MANRVKKGSGLGKCMMKDSGESFLLCMIPMAICLTSGKTMIV